eukprot:TRINITY_DN6393_c0_g1_i1.p1 TRINITY_DN6393_c0_g1~~TRINITY_DN6393_c0_g1_i1.p1  ORF type:complete len:230 (+),score=52.03 TRINITY_DN6393_c0_g1_i1:135-824(+)
MQTKITLRSTSGEVYEFKYDLSKTVSEFLQFIKDKCRVPRKARVAHQTTCLNNFPDKRLHELHLAPPVELIVTSRKGCPCYPESDIHCNNLEVMTLFGKKKKITPMELTVDRYIVAHVTDAKAPAKRSKRGLTRMIELAALMEENGDPGVILSMLECLQQVEADPGKVQQLIDMGFGREEAEKALARHANFVPKAAEYLLNQNAEIDNGVQVQPADEQVMEGELIDELI